MIHVSPRARSCAWPRATATAVAGLLLCLPASPALGDPPKRIAVVEMRSSRPERSSADHLESRLRVELGRRASYEVLPALTVAQAVSRAGLTRPVANDDATLARLGEIAGADLVFVGELGESSGAPRLFGRLVRVSSGGTWKKAETECLCETEAGRERAADRLAEELLGGGVGYPSKKRVLLVGAAAVAGGIAAAVLSRVTEGNPVPDGLPPLPDPPD